MKPLLFLTLFIPSLLLAQHTIEGVFSPPENYNAVLLYKVTPNVSEYITNSELNKDGSFKFKLDSSATKGIYRIVYAIPQEDYNFDVIYNAKEDIDLTFNSETGVTFNKSFENKTLSSYRSSMAMVTQSIGNYFRSQTKDTTALRTIFKTQKETQENFEKLAKGTLAINFIKANKPFIPKSIVGVNKYVELLKTHYFDHVDFNNQILQSSSFLEEKMLNYVFGMTANSQNETLAFKNNINEFCNAIKDAPIKVKHNLLVDLWQQMVDLEYDSIANYIAEEHLMDIAVSLNDQKLIKVLMLHIDTSIGSIAPDFPVQYQVAGEKVVKNISELGGAKNYVIVFWSTSCSHCLDEIPQLHEFLKLAEKGKLKVIAIALEDDVKPWRTLISDYPKFIHVYGKEKWENEIANTYGVSATPTYFILDKEKTIISKPKDFDDLKTFFQEN